MNPWPLAAACLLGAGFIAFWCSHARITWPLTVLAILTAVIALQLLMALRGDGTHHDLSAWRAMRATVVPALAGAMIGLVIGARTGRGLVWRSWWGAVTGSAFVVAGIATMLAWSL